MERGERKSIFFNRFGCPAAVQYVRDFPFWKFEIRNEVIFSFSIPFVFLAPKWILNLTCFGQIDALGFIEIYIYSFEFFFLLTLFGTWEMMDKQKKEAGLGVLNKFFTRLFSSTCWSFWYFRKINWFNYALEPSFAFLLTRFLGIQTVDHMILFFSADSFFSWTFNIDVSH